MAFCIRGIQDPGFRCSQLQATLYSRQVALRPAKLILEIGENIEGIFFVSHGYLRSTLSALAYATVRRECLFRGFLFGSPPLLDRRVGRFQKETSFDIPVVLVCTATGAVSSDWYSVERCRDCAEALVVILAASAFFGPCIRAVCTSVSELHPLGFFTPIERDSQQTASPDLLDESSTAAVIRHPPPPERQKKTAAVVNKLYSAHRSPFCAWTATA